MPRLRWSGVLVAAGFDDHEIAAREVGGVVTSVGENPVVGAAISGRDLLQSLVGKEIRTVTGRPNVILRLTGEEVIVGTARSPMGRPVPVKWVEQAIARLLADGEIEVSVPSLGYRSAFVGAVLLQLPSATLEPSSPPRIRLVTQ